MAAVAGIAGLAASAQPCDLANVFSGPITTVNTGGEVTFFIAEDATGDGVADLVGVRPLDFQVSVSPGLGDGVFGPPVLSPVASPPLTPGSRPLNLLVVSNGPGTPPSVIVSFIDNIAGIDPPSTDPFFVPTVSVSLLTGDGTGAFFQTAVLDAFASPDVASADDLDGDGDGDLVMFLSSEPVENFQVRLNNGDGTFQPMQSAGLTLDIPLAASAGDLNGDGIDDLVSPAIDPVTLGISQGAILGDGAGGFTDGGEMVFVVPPPIDTLTVGFSDIPFVDIDGDSRSDYYEEFIVGSLSPMATSSFRLDVAPNITDTPAGPVTFDLLALAFIETPLFPAVPNTRPQTDVVGFPNADVGFVQLDDDAPAEGFQVGPDGLDLLDGLDNGQFPAGTVAGPRIGVDQLAANSNFIFSFSDANNDGALDFIYKPAGMPGTVRVIFNACGEPTIPPECEAADTNGDGELDSSDFFAWVTAFTADPRTPAQEAACDVNRDGACNSSDFFAWVTAFTGAGCPGG